MNNETVIVFGTTAVLARSVERLTAVREVAGSNPRTALILGILNELRNEGAPFALQATRPSCGSDDDGPVSSRIRKNTVPQLALSG